MLLPFRGRFLSYTCAMEISRRALGKLALLAGAHSFFKGVQLGICSYSFRGLGLDELIRQMTAVPMGQLELESVFLGTDDIRAIRKKLDDAEIDVYAFNIPIAGAVTSDELDRIFRTARLLGAQAVNTATTLPAVPMIAAAAERHNLRVGLHPTGRAAVPGGIGSGDSYREAFAVSPLIGANLDLNGWRAWGPDPLAFIREIAPRITTMHTHDSKAADPRPVAVPFGEGNNPLREVLRLMQKEKLTFVAMLERTWNLPQGADNVASV